MLQKDTWITLPNKFLGTWATMILKSLLLSVNFGIRLLLQENFGANCIKEM